MKNRRGSSVSDGIPNSPEPKTFATHKGSIVSPSSPAPKPDNRNRNNRENNIRKADNGPESRQEGVAKQLVVQKITLNGSENGYAMLKRLRLSGPE
jgi:hypothetical protein